MNIPTSTPFPVPSFQNADADASPKQFLAFLHNLVAENLDGDPSIRIPASSRDSWVTVINGLSDHFLASFPTSDVVPWGAMHEKLDLIEITLEIVQRVTVRVDALYSGPGDAAAKIFVRLLGLCSALDSWVDVDILIEDEIPTPARLRGKAFGVAADLLRHLGGISTGGGSHTPSWKILRSILIECLDVGQGEYIDISAIWLMLTIYRLCVSAWSA
jgi:serine/threonine-protein kinase ATR